MCLYTEPLGSVRKSKIFQTTLDKMSLSHTRGSRDKSSLSGHDPSEPRSDAAAMTAENTTWSCEHPTDLVKTWCSQLCAFTQSQAQFKAAKVR